MGELPGGKVDKCYEPERCIFLCELDEYIPITQPMQSKPVGWRVEKAKFCARRKMFINWIVQRCKYKADTTLIGEKDEDV